MMQMTFGKAGERKYRTTIDGITFEGHTEYEIDTKIHEHRLKTDIGYRTAYYQDIETPIEVKTVTAYKHEVAMTSLVGVGGEYPLPYGNYFSVSLNCDDKVQCRDDILNGRDLPMVNMWCENYKEAKKRFDISTCRFDVFYDTCCIIVSDAIPKDWLLDEPFLKYNLRKGLRYGQREQICKYYKELGNIL